MQADLIDFSQDISSQNESVSGIDPNKYFENNFEPPLMKSKQASSMIMDEDELENSSILFNSDIIGVNSSDFEPEELKETLETEQQNKAQSRINNRRETLKIFLKNKIDTQKKSEKV